MASLAYFKRTLPAPTTTVDGFVCVLNEDWFLQADPNALDGTTFANGGGNLIVYEDAALTSRLSVDVMSFVTGASPNVEVWVRLPSYSSAKDVYISADDTQITQPLPSNTYGQYATYQDDVYVTHDGLTDRTGNSTITQSGSPSSGVSPWGGVSVSLNGSNQYGRASVSLPATRPLTYSAWAKPRSVPSQAAFIGGYNSDFSLRFTYDVIGIRESELSLWTRVDGNVIVKSTEDIILNDWVRVTGIATSDSERSVNVDGTVNTSTEANNPSTHTFNRISYGRHDDNSPSGYFNGELAGMRVTTRILSDSFLAIERLNQSDISSFGVSSDWTIPSSGISIELGSSNSQVASNNIDVELAGAVDISLTASIENVSSNNLGVSFFGVEKVALESSSSTLETNNLNVSFAGSINVNLSLSQEIVASLGLTVGSTLQIDLEQSNVEIQTNDVVIELGSQTDINLTQSNTELTSNNLDITLFGDIEINTTTSSELINSLNLLVSTGEQQQIGNVTAGFAINGIGTRYKEQTISVRYN